ncbi:MAG: VTT domain-containing protein [Anaerolineae bacterium]
MAEQNPEAAETAGPATAPKQERFGWKHLFALLFAAAVTVCIFVFQEELRSLEEVAYFGAFLAMLIGNATLILPVPGLIFVFSLGGTLNPLLVGLAAGPGAALGELTGYAAGFGGSALIDNFRVYRTFERWMKRYGLLAVAVLATIPNPLFDMAGIVAGASRIKWWQFLLAAWVGKTVQALLVAYAGALSLGWVEQLLAH